MPSESSQLTLPSIKAWRATELQLVVFPVDSQVEKEQKWWQHLAGSDNFESVRKRGERVDAGQFQGLVLQLSIDLFKITWGVGPVVEVDPSSDFQGPPDMGFYDGVLNRFTPLMDKWLSTSCPQISRIAFVAKLAHWTQEIKQTYEVLQKYIPTFEIDPDSSDFQYRVNRKGLSTVGVPDLKINRLRTWSSIMLKFGGFMVAGSMEKRLGTSIHHAAMLHLDVNTDQDFSGPLPQDRLIDVWHELIGIGNKIADKGDRE